MVISPRITSPDCTDFSSIPALLASPRFAGREGEQLALAIWEFMVDEREGFYHFWTPLERLTGQMVHDALKLLNVFGWGLCGTSANTIAILFAHAGLPQARVVGIKGHVVPEVFYGGAWHLLDPDLHAFHRKHPPDESRIASVADCVADPTLVSAQRNPSQPYYLPDRTPEKMADLYDAAPSHSPCFDEQAHTMDFVLRPGETLIRNTFNEGQYIWFDNYDELVDRYPKEWRDAGPRERNPPHRSFGNGRWVYEPQLTDAYMDFEIGVTACEGLIPRPAGLVAASRGANWCTFEFDSPYVYVGAPTGKDGRTARGGCLLEASVFLNNRQCSAKIELAVEPDLPWLALWHSTAKGRHQVKLDLTPHVANSYRYLLRFSFDCPQPGACRVESLRVDSSIMLAPATLGRLAEGANELTVRFGDARGLPTRRFVLETDLMEQDLRRKACRLENLRFMPEEPDRIGPAEADRDYEITFRIDAPPHGSLERIYAFGSFRCKSPDDPAEERVAAYLAPSPDGPWEPIFHNPVLPHPRRWHFSAQGERALAAGAKTAYVKFVAKAGMNNAKVRAAWLDERAAQATPLEITHIWEEASGCCKSHAERIESVEKPYEYELSCGRSPELRSLVMRAGSIRRDH